MMWWLQLQTTIVSRAEGGGAKLFPTLWLRLCCGFIISCNKEAVL